jgi:hypothetical protein
VNKKPVPKDGEFLAKYHMGFYPKLGDLVNEQDQKNND